MDWLFAERSPARPDGPPDPESRDGAMALHPAGTMSRSAELSGIEKWLIHRAYEGIAARSSCKKCGSALGRRLHFVPPAGHNPSSWRLFAVTRCSGWRGHRHVAGVAEASNDLVLGPFRLS
jgi:hypothetical protein